MSKWQGITNQVLNPQNALQVDEITPECYEQNKSTTNKAQMQDAKPNLHFESEAPLWTNHLGPCHAVCMYGDFEKNKTITGMMIGHFASQGWPILADWIKKMLSTMNPMCTPTGIYIIGGQPMSKLKVNEMEHHLDKAEQSLVKYILSPLTTDSGGRAGVIMYKKRIEWCVYSEKEERKPASLPSSSQSSDTVEEVVPAQMNQPRRVRQNRCNVL
jgi:hypothetical protein